MSLDKISSALNYHVANQVATLTICREKCSNAFDDILIQDFLLAFEAIRHDQRITFVVIQGQGKHFSAGADLNWMKKMANFSKEKNISDANQLACMMSELYHLEKITIAAVQGAAFGGGIGIISCCDIAIASRQANFCLSETKLGLSPAVISPYVCEALGIRQAKYAMLLAEPFDANHAKNIGLVQLVCDENTLTFHVQQCIQRLAQNGPNALIATKKLLLQIGENKTQYDKLTSELIATLRTSPEGQEGIKAFLDKRTPNWLTC